jgi:hypothetical protein
VVLAVEDDLGETVGIFVVGLGFVVVREKNRGD